MFKKGYIPTESHISNFKISKQKKMLSKYKWEIAEPYLDVELNISSTRLRSKKFITLRQFKTYSESGESLVSLHSKGISKHLLSFFSNFCQGKINITKDQFLKAYHSGWSLSQIGKKYDIAKGDMAFLRQLFQIKRKGATFIKRKRTEVPLTQRQKDILYGSMMGDAKSLNIKWNSVVHFKHSDKQEEYLKWKFNEFKSISKRKNLQFHISKDKREEYKGHYGSWSFYTKANSDVEECLNRFYGENGKQITKEILDNLSELSLAVWYMDDGTTDWRHRHIVPGDNASPALSFCTDSYSKESCDHIIEWFKDRWGIESNLRKRELRSDGMMAYRIVIKYQYNDTFFNLIRPHIVPSMLYKVDYEAYKKKKGYE